MPTFHSFRRLLLLAALVLGAGSARAHYYWWEARGQEAHLQFGMFGQGPVRAEVLARRQGFVAWTEQAGGATHRLEPRLVGSGWVAPLPAEAAWLCLSDETLPVKDLTAAGYGVCRVVMFSRRPLGDPREPAATARFLLDAVPSGNGRKVAVTFRGQPLPKAKVLVHDARGGTTELISNKSGLVTLPKSAAGSVVVQVLRKETTTGTFEGREYTGVLYGTTLALTLTASGVGR